MKNVKTFNFIIILCAVWLSSDCFAQIGYQVSLLNTATGEPQANKTVNVQISITNAEDEIVYTELQTATTNDFGILSLAVGKEDTFKNADWNKLPFYISATVNGTLIGKSQILTVPVAEYAKTAGTVLTKEMLVGTWRWRLTYTYPHNVSGETTTVISQEHYTYTFNADGTGLYLLEGTDYYDDYKTFTYHIVDRHIYLYIPIEDAIYWPTGSNLIESTTNYALFQVLTFIPNENKIMRDNHNIDGVYGILLVKD